MVYDQNYDRHLEADSHVAQFAHKADLEKSPCPPFDLYFVIHFPKAWDLDHQKV
jgi:hypothetical protein